MNNECPKCGKPVSETDARCYCGHWLAAGAKTLKASNLAHWVRSASITETGNLVVLDVRTEHAKHHECFVKSIQPEAVKAAKACFSKNFGRSDGKRTIWKEEQAA